MRLNLRQIEAFRAVCETGSMTAAGEVLGVTQPAISRLIRDLEQQFDLHLFTRKGGRISPTQDALALQQEVERCFDGLEQVVKFANGLNRSRNERLRIAAPVGQSYFYLPQVLERFYKERPGATVSLRSCSSPEVVEAIADGHSDIGLAILPAEVDGVVVEKLPERNLICILPENHPLTSKRIIRPKHLMGVPLLLVSDYSLMSKRLLQAIEAEGITPNVIFDCTYSGPVCSLVASGLGVSILDQLTAEAYADRGLVLRRFLPALPYDLKLVRSATRPLPEPGAVLLKILKSVIVEA